MNRRSILATGLLATLLTSTEANSFMILPCGVAKNHYSRELVPTRTEHYTVQQGDTLSQIALSHYNDVSKYEDIARYNLIHNPNEIEAGEVLSIPYDFEVVETLVGTARSLEATGFCTPFDEDGFEQQGRVVHDNVSPYCLKRSLQGKHTNSQCRYEINRRFEWL